MFKLIVISCYICFALSQDEGVSLNGKDHILYVLVVGAAGFLGNSLFLHLHKTGIKSIGIDNFNGETGYIALKRRRQRNLKESTGVNIIEADACDLYALNNLLLSNKFTHILYFASQSGNRFNMINETYSIKHKKKKVEINNISYVNDIRSNLVCFNVLISAIDRLYSSNEVKPFLIYSHPQNHLHDSSYKTTVSSGLSASLVSQHPMSILQFGEVYGPWSNPNIIQTILQAYLLNDVDLIQRMMRMSSFYNFTYIDDIVEAVTASLMKWEWNNTAHHFRQPKTVTVSVSNLMKSIEHTAKLPPTSSSVTNTPFHSNLLKYTNWYKREYSKKIPCESECSSTNKQLCFRTSWDGPMNKSRELSNGCQWVAYTVATGDEVRHLNTISPLMNSSTAAAKAMHRCLIAFVSLNAPIYRKGTFRFQSIGNGFLFTKKLKVKMYREWMLIPVDSLVQFPDPRKASRVPKLSPGLFFARSVKYAIYIDTKYEIQVSIDTLQAHMNQYQTKEKSLTYEPVLLATRLARYPHMYKEIDHILYTSNRLNTSFYLPELRNQKLAYLYYEKLHDLHYTNVFDGGFLIHSLHSKYGKQVRCAWYKEYLQWADRDQPTGNFVFSKLFKESGLPSPEKAILPIAKQNAVAYCVKLIDAQYGWKGKKTYFIEKRFQWNY